MAYGRREDLNLRPRFKRPDWMGEALQAVGLIKRVAPERRREPLAFGCMVSRPIDPRGNHEKRGGGGGPPSLCPSRREAVRLPRRTGERTACAHKRGLS